MCPRTLLSYLVLVNDTKEETMDMTRDYHKNFNSEWFHDAYHVRAGENTKSGMTRYFILSSLHRYFASDIDFGHCLWDVGSGPTIWSILSASRRMQHIILSDYTPRNLQILNDWRDGKRNEVASLIQLEMELAGQNQQISDREAQIRSKVSGIYQIDVTKDGVFLDADLDGMMADVITSCFCFEVATEDKESYSRSVKNVTKMLKPGGYLMLLGGVEETYYRVDKFMFPVANLTSKDIRSIYEENGFEMLDMETLYQDGHVQETDEDVLSDNTNVFALFAKKKVF